MRKLFDTDANVSCLIAKNWKKALAWANDSWYIYYIYIPHEAVLIGKII